MKILVVGGTGMIGGHAALHLRSKGHQVTISGRRAPTEVPALLELPLLQGNYLRGDITAEQLALFEAVVFAAGSDVRHVPEGQGADEHYLQANVEAVPAFARLSREAGVRVFVHIGSAYSHIVPEAVHASPYVRSRKLAADGVAALATRDFRACSLDPPIVVGTAPGMKTPMFEAYIQYAEGNLPIPSFAPAGGLNFISTQSLSEAIAGAIESSEAVSGRSILVGDENLTYAEYFEMFFHAIGNPQKLPVLDKDHPLLPRAILYAGDGVVTYEPDAADVAALGGYRRNDIKNAISDVVSQHRQRE
ncbi:hypothetical protein GCG54_00009850 [Colletotrichum gloeosporioides]|uniref:NAD-dependent epimerase/dehydratase domain-containing protein n=1 Tax=Colletotrichum gloeosporioides TaxID=474922 RepID=A0A8H4FRU6_COLGL|nr:uncharacterized protein GCG54_00009850 [Colletotrichum gloeosporioides]KAF3812165.1 hypothetical protein GCG54_00009850 [Colletotrichum gloeosporioides]